MKKFYIYFSGRKRGALGVHGHCEVCIEAESQEEAWDKLHQTYESGPTQCRQIWYFTSIDEPLTPREVLRGVNNQIIQHPYQ